MTTSSEVTKTESPAVRKTARLSPLGLVMALPPVFMLPISYFFFKERFGWQSVAGTFMAMAGVALFFIK